MTNNGSALRPSALDRRLVTSSTRRFSGSSIVLALSLVQLGVQIGIARLLAQQFSAWLSRGVGTDTHSPLAALAGLVAIALVSQYVMTRTLQQMSRRAMNDLTADVFTQVTSGASPSNERVGGLTVALTSGLHPLEGYFSRYLPALVQAILTPLVLLGVVAALDPLAAGVLAVGLLVMPIATAIVGRRAEASASKQWRALYALSARYGELLHGLTTLRLLTATDRARGEVDEATTNYGTTTLSALKLAFQSSLVAEFTTGVAVGLSAMVIGFQLLAGQTTATRAFTIVLIAAEIYAPLRRASAEFHAAASGRAAAASLFDVLDQPVERHLNGLLVEHSTSTLRLSGVTVHLVDGRSTTPLTTTLAPGDVLVIAGESGAGKSTLLTALASALGKSAYFVPQTIEVFATSVANNLILDGRGVSDEERAAACRATGFDVIVERLRHGFSTELGDGGVSLSAGELRRLGLTRALMSDRQVLILDEPTANLDGEAIAGLRHTLQSAFTNRVVIVTTHGQEPVVTPTVLHTLEGRP